MKYFLLSLSLILSACGASQTKDPLNIPDEMKADYYEFYQIVNFQENDREHKPTLIEFVYNILDVPGAVVDGRCEPGNPDGAVIQVRTDSWNTRTDIQKKALLFHELTHCTFHSLIHSSDRNSYMYATSTAENQSLTNDQLIKQVVDYTNHL